MTIQGCIFLGESHGLKFVANRSEARSDASMANFHEWNSL